jgi:hypothetical protein
MQRVSDATTRALDHAQQHQNSVDADKKPAAAKPKKLAAAKPKKPAARKAAAPAPPKKMTADPDAASPAPPKKRRTDKFAGDYSQLFARLPADPTVESLNKEFADTECKQILSVRNPHLILACLT